MTSSRIIGGIGRTLISAGVLILLFVVYQLWGTGIHEARAQNKLENDFNQALAEAGVNDSFSEENISAPSPSDTTEASTTTAAENLEATTTTADVTTTTSPYGPAPEQSELGEPLARIRIPAIGVDKVVVSGVDVESLKDGPGHYRGTPLPGQPGNAAIAGHRTTYGAPFYSLDELEEGDEIFVSTLQGSFTYLVKSLEVVTPNDVYVLDPTDDNRLTLTTCNPRLSARQRLVVVAELQGEPAPSPFQNSGMGIKSEPPSENLGDTTTSSTEVSNDVADTTITTDPVTPVLAAPQEFDGGLGGIAISKWPAILWGLLSALIWLGFWVLGRVWRRWPSYAIGTPIFLVVLFIFFENFARLLPANI